MFPDVQARFSVSPAALCQQIQDRRQFFFDSFTLKKNKNIKSYPLSFGALS